MNHNQERFAQITGNSQVEYTQAWDELVRYATDKAKGYFTDGVSLDEAIDETMSGEKDSAVAWLIKIHHNPVIIDKDKNAWGYLKRLIRNRLQKLSKAREYYPSSLRSISGDVDSDNDDEDSGGEIIVSSYRAFTPVEKPIKARDSIIVLYAYGESKDEIVKDCGVSRRYVNMVIQESAKEIAELKVLKSGIGN